MSEDKKEPAEDEIQISFKKMNGNKYYKWLKNQEHQKLLKAGKNE